MTNVDTLTLRPLSDVARLIASKDLSPVALTEAVLSAIRQKDEYLNAYVVVDHEGARKAASEAEGEILKGQYRGPLHGIPIAVKDIFGTRGLPTRCGSIIDEVLVPDQDADVVKSLRRAGAVIVGKTVTTEFALSGYHPENQPPQNPWGENRWAGVSSSGSAVATSAGLAFGALGTDTGGSIRFPAAVNGIVGLKPTYDRLSTAGVFPLAPSLDHVGVFGRRVLDVMLLFSTLAGLSPIDPNQRISKPPRLRIGVDLSFIKVRVDPEVATAFAWAVAVLEEQGHQIVELDFSQFSDFAVLWGPVTALEAVRVHQNLFTRHSDQYGPVFRNLLEQGFRLTADQAEELRIARRVGVERLLNMFQHADVLACPSAPFPAMSLSDFPPHTPLPDEAAAEFVTFTAPFNFAGLPSMSAPCGFSSDGLPLGLQLIGKHGQEETLLQLMNAYEEATDWHQYSPPAGPDAS